MQQTKVWYKICFLFLKTYFETRSRVLFPSTHTHAVLQGQLKHITCPDQIARSVLTWTFQISIWRTHPRCWENASVLANEIRVSGFIQLLFFFFSWWLEMWKARVIHVFKWNNTRLRYCTDSQLRRFMPRGHRSTGSDRGQILAQSSTYTQRQKYIPPVLQPDDVLWGKIKELQVRSKSERFPTWHLPRDSICFSAASERVGTAPVPKSLPQQMLQKVDVLRG